MESFVCVRVWVWCMSQAHVSHTPTPPTVGVQQDQKKEARHVHSKGALFSKKITLQGEK